MPRLDLLILAIAMAAILLMFVFPRGVPLRLRIGSPVGVLVIFVFFYAVIAHLYALHYLKEHELIGRDFRSVLRYGLMSTGVFLVSFMAGYLVLHRRFNAQVLKAAIGYRPPPPVRAALIRWAWRFLVVGWGSMILWMYLNDVKLDFSFQGDVSRVEAADFESKHSYLSAVFDLVIPAIVLLLIARSRLAVPALGVFLVVCVLIGFRYRISVVLIAVFAYYALVSRRNFKFLATWLLLGLASVSAMAIIGMTRVYNQGLDTERVSEGFSLDEFLFGLFAEPRSVMYTLSAVIDYCGTHAYYLGASPILYAVSIFVPRAIWPNKPIPENIGLLERAIGTPEAIDAGAAVPLWGEFFMAFGWPGVAAIGLIAGFVVKAVFTGLANAVYRGQINPVWIAFYCSFTGFSFFAFQRGYMGQWLQEFFAIALSVLVVNSSVKRAIRRSTRPKKAVVATVTTPVAP